MILCNNLLMSQTELNKLSKKIRSLRLKKKLTQERLSEISGVSYKHLQKIEGNYPHIPKLDTLQKLAKAFKISVSELLKL